MAPTGGVASVVCGGVAVRMRRRRTAASHSARARHLGHGQVSGGPPRQPLSPDAPGGVRPDLGSGCPTNGECGCGRSSGAAEEFNCQLDRLPRPTSRSPRTFSTAARGRRLARRDERLPGTRVLRVGPGRPGDRAAGARGCAGSRHFWGGCHDDVQYRRVAQPPRAATCSASTSTTARRTWRSAASRSSWNPLARRLGGLRQGVPEPRAVDDTEGLARWSNAAYVGDLPVDFAGLKEGVARVLAAGASCRAARRAHRLRLPEGHDPLRGGVLPPPALRRPAAGDGAHPFANSRPLAPRVRLGPAARVPALGLVPQGAGAVLLQPRLPEHDEGEAGARTTGPDARSLLIGDEIYAPIVTSPTRRMDIELPPGSGSTTGTRAACLSGRAAVAPGPTRTASRSSSAAAPSSRCGRARLHRPGRRPRAAR